MKYNYNGKTLNEKELIDELVTSGQIKKDEKELVKLYVYVFDIDKRLVKKNCYNVPVHDNGSVSFKFEVEWGANEEPQLYTKNILKGKISTKDKIKPYRCRGACQREYFETKEEPDYPYFGGTHYEHRYQGQETYLDGKMLSEKFHWRKDYDYSDKYYSMTANGVNGPRYEIYSFEPLTDSDFENWQSDQKWFKIKKFDEMKQKGLI